MTHRRTFLTQLSALGAAALALDPAELRAATGPAGGAWDLSWLDKLAGAKYRVVFNASDIADGTAMDYAARFLDGVRDADGARDGEARPVIVFRHLGTAMGFNDAMWAKYHIGESRSVNDPDTNAPATRNIYWKAKSSTDSSIETLNQRGLISLVCNIATDGLGAQLAKKNGGDVEDVRKDLKANMVPGAYLVPSGIYGLIRAQNAGCAYMPGA